MTLYNQQEFDFITRTKKIIEQYKNCELDEKFEVTLLINCCVGLLMVPQQHWYESLPSHIVSEEWGITQADISISTNEKNIANVARHLRNSISHYRFEQYGNSEIEGFEFSQVQKLL